MSPGRYLLCLLLTGCGGASTGETFNEPISPGSEAVSWSDVTAVDQPAVDQPAVDQPQSRARSRSLSSPSPGQAEGRFEATRISSPPAVKPRYGSGRLIDVSLHRADVRNAIRFIADAGKMNVVVGEGVQGTVSLELTRVRADDALVAIVRAHGARLEAQGDILIVHSN